MFSFLFLTSKLVIFFLSGDWKLKHWLYQELYHESQALDRFEQDYRRKLAEVESLKLPRRGWSRYCFDQPWLFFRTLSFIFIFIHVGESIIILQNELKNQRKLVRSLQKKSLWSRNLGEASDYLIVLVCDCVVEMPVVIIFLLLQIIEKLVDVVCYIRQTIVEVFGNNGNDSLYFWSSDKDPTCGKQVLIYHSLNHQ